MDYRETTILLASKHQKEEAIAPSFSSVLQANIEVADSFDTDLYGTFTGEVERCMSQYETRVAKAKDAAQLFNADYTLSSEGSFFPNPMMPLLPCNLEMLVFYDRRNDLLVSEQAQVNETNFNSRDFEDFDRVESFLKDIHFPSHGVVMRTANNDTYMKKGIKDWKHVRVAFEYAKRLDDVVRIETDMRAMMNPTRMHVISIVANKLVKRLSQHCPSCEFPGFGKVVYEGKLACSACGSQSEFYQSEIHHCVCCEYSEKHPRKDGLGFADPQYCQICNP